MKILLDTHIFLWYLVEPDRLNSDQIKLLSDQNVSKLLNFRQNQAFIFYFSSLCALFALMNQLRSWFIKAKN
jgi:hypothetical protein